MISEKATHEYEKARNLVAGFINAGSSREIVFTRNATESINLVNSSWVKQHVGPEDEIVTSVMEHHSNFVPWQQFALLSGCILKIWNIDKSGIPEYSDLDKLITRKTKLLTITSMSNVLGTIFDIEKVVNITKTINPDCIVLVDAAQSVPHLKVDVKKWKADFIVFSGHKMMGPTGIGELLESMPPYQYGGDMISEVHLEKTLWNTIPHKFEAGTPHIAGAIGLGAAVKYLSAIGMENVRLHEKGITAYALKSLAGFKDITVYGPLNADYRGGVISFCMKGIHPHDIAQILDRDNVCIRVGFHCAQPLHEYIGCGPTARASFYAYTTEEDIDQLVGGLEKVRQIFR
jgi:cysteine desulfurase/selenocysteine lyase